MAMTQHQELPSRTKKSVDFKRFFGGLTTVTALMTAFLLKALVLVIKTPFFILFYLKNWAVIGVMTSIFYAIVGGLYYFNQPEYQYASSEIGAVLWTDTRILIVVIISAILAFFATYGEFTD